MTALQEKRRALCREIYDSNYCRMEDEFWQISDSLACDRIDGHDAADQFLMAYHRKIDEIMELMDEYYACFREEDDEDIQ